MVIRSILEQEYGDSSISNNSIDPYSLQMDEYLREIDMEIKHVKRFKRTSRETPCFYVGINNE